MSDKTEEPTFRRRQKAREEGDSGASTQAAQAVGFVIAVALAPQAVRALAAHAAAELRECIARAGRAGDVAPAFDPAALTSEALALALPLLGAAALGGAVAQLAQTGGVFSSKKITPRLDRLDLASGLRGLFSTTRAFAALRSLALAAGVAALTYDGLRGDVLSVARTAGRLPWIGVVASTLAGRLAWRAAVLGLFLGGLDAIVARRSWLARLRMTKQEVTRENRDAEGDPQIKAARERANQEMLAQATVANVKNASVVVVNPTHRACALRYDVTRGDDAPVVVARGEGDLAARIRSAAQDHGIPIVRDVPLAHALGDLAVGDAIPEALYEAVAEILRELGAT